MTAPLVPAEVDLRDFAFMPLDVVRLRDSGLAAKATGDEFRAAVLLWCASWHQVPAASLPDDDAELSSLAGYGRVVKEWKRVRQGALRGWIKCDDGRLYHPTVAEKARESWRGKLEQRWRSEAARVKKHNQRHQLTGADMVVVPEFNEWISLGCPQGHALSVPRDKNSESRGQNRETASKGQGEGQGQGQGLEKLPTSSGGRGDGSPSDSGGSAPPPSPTATPPDPVKAVFDRGVAALGDTPSTRSLIGKARKQFGDLAVIEIIAALEREVPSDPVPWFVAACKSRAVRDAAAKQAEEPREPSMEEITV